jgi:hypothetical protein
MKLSLRPAITSAAVLAIAGGVLAATVGMAAAATTPPWEPDPGALGSLTFYNSAGQVVTGGTNLNHLFDYAVASTADATHGTKATLEFAQPLPSTPTGSFATGLGSLSTNFPNAAAPAPINATANPVVTLGAGDANLTNFIATQVQPTAPGFANAYQIRVFTGGAGGVGTGSSSYWESDIQVNPANGSWQETFPTGGVVPTATVLTANPNPASLGVSDTLTATETPATPGNVVFTDTTTSTTLGTAAVNASGVATLPSTFSSAATQNLTATFTPTDTVNYTGSSGTLSLAIVTPTTTTLTVTQSGIVGSDVSLSSTVTPVGTAGTVSWYNNGSATPLNATPVTPNASGIATLDLGTSLPGGSYSIVAKFTPTNTTLFGSSQSAPQAFVLQTGACSAAGSNCIDTQNIQATIPVGTLVLSTPYTPTSPLDLGNLALTAGLTEYTGTAPFNNIIITDTRSGDLPWTLTALATNLSDGGSHPGSLICNENVGLTAIAATPGLGFAGTVTPTANPAAAPLPVAPVGGVCTGTQGLGGPAGTLHTVAAANAGLGTVTLNGTLTLVAPVSTEPGLFKGTITFTVG